MAQYGYSSNGYLHSGEAENLRTGSCSSMAWVPQESQSGAGEVEALVHTGGPKKLGSDDGLSDCGSIGGVDAPPSERCQQAGSRNRLFHNHSQEMLPTLD